MQPHLESFLPLLALFVVVGLIFAAIPARIHGYGQRINAFLGRPNARVLYGFLPDSAQGVRVFGVVLVTFGAAMAALYLFPVLTLA